MVDYEAGARLQELTAAVDAAARAELDQYRDIAAHRTLTEKYGDVMHALFATGTVPKSEVAARGKRLIETRIYELHERAKGTPRDAVRIPHSLYYARAKELGYTRAYGMSRKELEASGEDPVTIAPPRRRRSDIPDFSAANARYIEAFSSLADGMKVVSEWLSRMGPFEDHVESEHREMIVVIAAAFRRNIHDMASDTSTIPTNAQRLAIDSIVSALAVDEGLRQYFLSHKEMRVFRAKERGKKHALDMRAILELLKRAPARLMPWMEFVSSTEAQWVGFYGQQCDSCRSFRMIQTEGSHDTLTCIACRAVHPRRPAIFCPKCHYHIETVEEMRSPWKCPHCEMDIKLPASLARGMTP